MTGILLLIIILLLFAAVCELAAIQAAITGQEDGRNSRRG